MRSTILPLIVVLAVLQAMATSIPAFLYVPVRLDDSTEVGTSGISLRFDKVLEESRCPINMQCIHPGNAAIILTAMKDGQSVEFILNTADGKPQKKTLWGYSFSIHKLKPYPGTEAPIWLDTLVQTFQRDTKSVYPKRVYKCYPVSGQSCTEFMNTKRAPYYYVPAGCCDQFSTLYDSTGKVFCHPGGGITGNGDGKCPGLLKSMTRCLLWEYPGPRPNLPWADIRYDKENAGANDVMERKQSGPAIPILAIAGAGHGNTTFAFTIAKSGEINLTIYDVLGKPVANVSQGHRNAGKHVVSWNGKGMHGNLLPSGIYLARLTSPGIVTTRKMGIFSARQ